MCNLQPLRWDHTRTCPVTVKNDHSGLEYGYLKLCYARQPNISCVQKHSWYLWGPVRHTESQNAAWSDESEFQLVFMINVKNRFCVQTPTSVMVWGCNSVHGVGDLCMCEGTNADILLYFNQTRCCHQSNCVLWLDSTALSAVENVSYERIMSGRKYHTAEMWRSFQMASQASSSFRFWGWRWWKACNPVFTLIRPHSDLLLSHTWRHLH